MKKRETMLEEEEVFALLPSLPPLISVSAASPKIRRGVAACAAILYLLHASRIIVALARSFAGFIAICCTRK